MSEKAEEIREKASRQAQDVCIRCHHMIQQRKMIFSILSHWLETKRLIVLEKTRMGQRSKQCIKQWREQAEVKRKWKRTTRYAADWAFIAQIIISADEDICHINLLRWMCLLNRCITLLWWPIDRKNQIDRISCNVHCLPRRIEPTPWRYRFESIRMYASIAWHVNSKQPLSAEMKLLLSQRMYRIRKRQRTLMTNAIITMPPYEAVFLYFSSDIYCIVLYRPYSQIALSLRVVHSVYWFFSSSVERTQQLRRRQPRATHRKYLFKNDIFSSAKQTKCRTQEADEETEKLLEIFAIKLCDIIKYIE